MAKKRNWSRCMRQVRFITVGWKGSLEECLLMEFNQNFAYCAEPKSRISGELLRLENCTMALVSCYLPEREGDEVTHFLRILSFAFYFLLYFFNSFFIWLKFLMVSEVENSTKNKEKGEEGFGKGRMHQTKRIIFFFFFRTARSWLRSNFCAW